MPTPNVRQLMDGDLPVYPITDRSLVIGLQDHAFAEYAMSWDGASTPVVANIPAGVVVNYNGTDYTGTLAASASTVTYIYLVASATQPGEFDRYITTHTGSTYAWQPLGSTAIVSPTIADDLVTNDSSKALSAKQGKILGEKTTELDQKVDENLVLSDVFRKEPSDLASLNNTGISSSPYKIQASSGYRLYYVPVKRGQTVTVHFTLSSGYCLSGTTATIPAVDVAVDNYSSRNYTYTERTYTAVADCYFVMRFGATVTTFYVTLSNTGFGGDVKRYVDTGLNSVETSLGAEMEALDEKIDNEIMANFVSISAPVLQISANKQYFQIPTRFQLVGYRLKITIVSSTDISGTVNFYKNKGLSSSGQILIDSNEVGLIANTPYSFEYDFDDVAFTHIRSAQISDWVDVTVTLLRVSNIEGLLDVTPRKVISGILEQLSPNSNYLILPFDIVPNKLYRVKLKLAVDVTNSWSVTATTGNADGNSSPLFSVLPNGVAGTELVFIGMFPDAKRKYLFSYLFSNGVSEASISYEALDLDVQNLSQNLQNELGIGTNILAQNPLATKVLSNLALANAYGRSNDVLVVAHITDTHGDNINVARFNEFCDHFADAIDVRINTGDVVNQTFNWKDYYENELYADTLITIGNHDVLKYEDGETSVAYVGLPAFERYIEPNYEGWGVTLAEGADENGYCWYYKDFTDKKIRLICLDPTNNIATQRSWLAEVLAETLDENDDAYGYSVILAMHYIPNTEGGIIYFNSPFTTFFATNPPSFSFPGIVAEFMSNGGKFIAWMVGHTHRDYIGYASVDVNGETYKEVFICAAGGALNASTQDGARVRGQKSEDLFNLYGFDTTNKVIKIFRVGADQDLWMRNKYTACINYETAEVIKTDD